jgi:ferric-dicitrate binding protein FerR (iron transport regulator)
VFVSVQLTTRATTLEVARGERPLRVALTSGDTVLAAPGTKLEVLAQDVAHRELRLSEGTALFDVVRLHGAQRFEVETRQARVQVRGTVFSVEVTNGRTIVRVYEGQVWVTDRGLSAGQVWVSSGPAPSLIDDALWSEGTAAAALRSAAPSLTVSLLPEVTSSRPSAATDAGSLPTATIVIVPGTLASPLHPEPASDRPASVSLTEARGWLLGGESERALQAAQAEHVRVQPAWQLLAADALRALRRHAEAVDAYQALAERDPSLRASAGYSGASLYFHELGDPDRALALLDALSLDADDSPLRERASVLRVDVLLALQRHDEVRGAAQRYLEREPETRVSRRMRALVR